MQWKLNKYNQKIENNGNTTKNNEGNDKRIRDNEKIVMPYSLA